MNVLGPVQLLVLELKGGKFDRNILAELRRLREHEIIRLVDLLFVAKDELGGIAKIEFSGLSVEEREESGALVGALLAQGAGGEEAPWVDPGAPVTADWWQLDEEDIWYLADAIPPGTSSAIALIEHRWAIPLRDAVEAGGGRTLADTWVHREDLIAIGAVSR
ncbi:MAG: hypothetical protein ACRDPE_01385 [Solirubrobacterales bacterium]